MTTPTKNPYAPLSYGVIISIFLLVTASLAASFPLLILIPILIMGYGVVGFVWSGIFPPFPRKIFTPLKIITLTTALLIIPLMILGYYPIEWCEPIVIFFIVLNISEAISVDLKEKNFLNAISGTILLILAIFYFQITWKNPYILIGPSVLLFWIIAYSIWNWNYVILNYTAEESLYHFYVIMTPLIYILIRLDTAYWLLIRTETLLIAMIMHYTIGKKLVFPHLKIKKYETFANSIIKNFKSQISILILVILLCVPILITQ